MFLYKNCIYYIWQRAIKRAADESGAFKDVSEEDLAQYVGDTAKLFADQVLAEAQMRNAPIDTVLKASDIVYEDDGLWALDENDPAGGIWVDQDKNNVMFNLAGLLNFKQLQIRVYTEESPQEFGIKRFELKRVKTKTKTIG